MVSRTTISHRHAAGQPLSDALRPALAAADGFVREQALGTVLGHRLAIVVEELVANLVDHAAQGRDLTFSLALDRRGDTVGLILDDDSHAFDPRGAAPIEMPNADRGGGGGLALVKAWCAIVGYDSDARGNRLVLRFHPIE
jgi:anti-sigma regulatory factor (Ser/Thr protein kinase)